MHVQEPAQKDFKDKEGDGETAIVVSEGTCSIATGERVATTSNMLLPAQLATASKPLFTCGRTQ